MSEQPPTANAVPRRNPWKTLRRSAPSLTYGRVELRSLTGTRFPRTRFKLARFKEREPPGARDDAGNGPGRDREPGPADELRAGPRLSTEGPAPLRD